MHTRGHRHLRRTEGEVIPIKETTQGLTFLVKVHPRAKRDELTGTVGDALKVALTSPPLDGRANEACMEFFAKLLKVPRASVTIATGLGSRNKVLRITGVTVTHLESQISAALKP